MKAYDNLLRLKHFQMEDKTRQLTQISMMIAEFQHMVDELNTRIRIEEEKTGVSDPSHFAYPTFARAAIRRRDNLITSIRDLNEKRIAAQNALDEENAELCKIRFREARDKKDIPDEEMEEQKFSRPAMIA